MSLRRVLALQLRADAEPERVAEFERTLAEAPHNMPMVSQSRVGHNIISKRAPGWNLTWDVLFPGADSIDPYMAHPYHKDVIGPFFGGSEPVVEKWEAVYFEPTNVSVAEPNIKDCIKRSLIIAPKEGTPAKHLNEFEQMLGDMVKHIPSIINWGLNRSSSVHPTPYMFIWEQEFRDLDGYRAYGAHPYHWGPLDDWFDHERPGYIIDRTFQIFYPTPGTVLGWQP